MVEILPIRHVNHGSDGSEEDGGNANVAKATAMCVLFLCSFTLGSIPVKLTKWLTRNDKEGASVESNKYVKMLLALGGGVLLCTTFLHLLPEVSENFEDLNLTPHLEIHYAELLMCVGFFVMYLVEECVHFYLHKREKDAKDISPLMRSLSIRRGEDPPRPSITQLKDVTSSSPVKHNHTHGGHTHTHLLQDEVDSTVKAIRGLLVVLALSVHELFEGLSVGLESSANNVWYMFGAVAAHKLVIAFCIGVELVTTNMKTLLIIIYVFTFAVVSPLGIGIGMAISNLEQSLANGVSVFLQGLASGTLLYVVFFEILQNDRKSGLMQYLAVLVGFFIMFAITIL